MPRVRILDSLAGQRFSFVAGEEVDLPADTAKSWVATGHAEYVTGRHIDTPERAAAAPETRRRPGRPRKPTEKDAQ